MKIPRRGTRIFALLESLFLCDEQTADEVLKKIGRNVSPKQDKRIFSDAIAVGYIEKNNDIYKLSDEARWQVADVMEIFVQKDDEEIVPSRFVNMYTRPMVGYEKQLFANKRGS